MGAARARLRRHLGYLLLAIGSVGVALGSAELGLRAFGTPALLPPRPVPPELRHLHDLRTQWELAKPNLRALNGGARFETNRHGLRGPERSPEKPPGVFRIALIGDSFAMGWGVEEPETYAARLERALDRPGSGAATEVINFGLAGLNASGAVARFREKALAFDPDLVVYGFTLNDLEGSAYRGSYAADLGSADGVVGHRWSLRLWDLLAPRIHGLLEVIWPRPGSYVHELDDNYFDNAEALGEATRALERLAASADERGICAVILIHTRLHFLNALHPYRRHYDAIAAAASQRGLFTVASIDAFLGRKDRELWVWHDDPHPGPEAHAILAEVLRAGLAELPDRCWHGGLNPAVGAPR